MTSCAACFFCAPEKCLSHRGAEWPPHPGRIEKYPLYSVRGKQLYLKMVAVGEAMCKHLQLGRRLSVWVNGPYIAQHQIEMSGPLNVSPWPRTTYSPWTHYPDLSWRKGR